MAAEYGRRYALPVSERTVIRSRRIVLATGEHDGALLVEGGKVRAVLGSDELPAGVAVDDLGELALLPGVVDTHVHVNAPGREEWEGWHSASDAAAAGGVTT